MARKKQKEDVKKEELNVNDSQTEEVEEETGSEDEERRKLVNAKLIKEKENAALESAKKSEEEEEGNVEKEENSVEERNIEHVEPNDEELKRLESLVSSLRDENVNLQGRFQALEKYVTSDIQAKKDQQLLKQANQGRGNAVRFEKKHLPILKTAVKNGSDFDPEAFYGTYPEYRPQKMPGALLHGDVLSFKAYKEKMKKSGGK